MLKSMTMRLRRVGLTMTMQRKGLFRRGPNIVSMNKLVALLANCLLQSVVRFGWMRPDIRACLHRQRKDERKYLNDCRYSQD